MRLSGLQYLVAVAAALAIQSSSIGPWPSTGNGSAAWAFQPSPLSDRSLPGRRVLLDAHNAYPERGRFAERLEDALATGLPVAIEQDLAWCSGRDGNGFAPRVSHETTCDGSEPTLEAYFFARVAPILEAAVSKGATADWPLITLNLDFKTDEPEHHAAVWALLGAHERWLTTAVKTSDLATVSPLEAGPLLVLTGSNDIQQRTFYDAVPIGQRLRLFGAIRGVVPDDPASGVPRATPASNYRRWWNHPWKAVEIDGQPAAGAWTEADEARLTTIVRDAHANGLWIRFYTLNGLAGEREGWTPSYNFGSPEAVARRWRAAIAAGVDFVATDQYAEFADLRKRQ